MDELQLIRSFRADAPELDSEARRAARDDLIARIEAARSSRHWPRLAVVFAALALAAVTAASALALYDFIAGDPAPPDVTRLIVEEGTAERIGPIFSGNPDALAKAAHGVAALETSEGRVLLWAAPTRGNAICYFVEFERLSERRGSPQGETNCVYRPLATEPSPTVPVFYVLHRATIEGTELAILVGWTNESVQSLALRSPNGDERELALFENFFIAAIPPEHVPRDSRDGEPFEVVAKDRAGTELRPIPITEQFGSLFLGSRGSPKVVGARRIVTDTTDSLGRTLRLSVIPIEGGQRCIEVKTASGTSTGCGPRLWTDEGIQVHPTLMESMVFLKGSVGPEVEKLELHHQDGTVVELPIVERLVLHDIPRARFEDGKRPILLVARDRHGAEVAREKVSQRSFVLQSALGHGDLVDPTPGRPGRP
jgi:hypothetical protein